jgi:hypothetical protein
MRESFYKLLKNKTEFIFEIMYALNHLIISEQQFLKTDYFCIHFE